MVEIAVKTLGTATGAALVAGDADRVCHGCVIDSRQVEGGAVFVAFPGEKVDGNDFAASAIAAGAGAVVMTREPDADVVTAANESGCGLLVTSDPTEFLLRLAHEYRRSLTARVIGVTGSIGKTTTKDVMAELLGRRFRVWVTKGNYNNLIGMPLTILSAPADTEILILEMGMNHPGEIDRLSRCAEPSFGVITKVGTSHIGLLGSRENIARAKAEIVAGMRAAAGDAAPVLVLGGEDDFTPFIADGFAAPAGVEVLRVGSGRADAVRYENLDVDDLGYPSFDMVAEDGSRIATKLSIPGAHSVQNALYGAAIALRLGITPAEVDETFRDLHVTGRRQEIRRAACGARVIDDSYNASPESMAAGLDLLCRLKCTGSRVAILGEMGELGDEARRLHELTGAYVAAKKPDLFVCVGGENAAAMADAAKLMGLDEDIVTLVPDWKAALGAFGQALSAEDLVLVKGSRFVELDRFVEGVC